MEEDLKSDLKSVVQEFVSRKITDRKLSVDGQNCLQWKKIVEVHVRGRGNKRYLAEPPQEPMTNEWERGFVTLRFPKYVKNGVATRVGDIYTRREYPMYTR